MSWIKLVRLPFKLWGENNFEQITSKFGEMIALFDEIYHRIDLSCAKIGILIDRCTKINEEIYVTTEGEVIKVAVVEFDEDWFMFCFDTSKEYYF